MEILEDRADLPAAALGASELLETEHGLVAGRPGLDLEAEARVQAFVRAAVERKLLASAHDVSDGGLAVAVAESCILGGVGAELELGSSARPDAALFGEAPAHVIVSVAPEDRAAFEAAATEAGVPICSMGTVGGEALRIRAAVDLPLSAIMEAWSGAVG